MRSVLSQLLFLFVFLNGHHAAFAQAPTDDTSPQNTTHVEAPTVDLDFLVREAVRRTNIGDYIGSEIQLVIALEQILRSAPMPLPVEPWLKGDFSLLIHLSEEHHRNLVEVLFLYAGTLQEKGQPRKALAIFDALHTRHADNHRSLNIQYRSALAWSQLNDHKKALDVMRAIGPRSQLNQVDKRQIQLMQFVFKFRRKPSFRAARKVDRQLSRIKGIRHIRAKIRTELVAYFHRQMEQYPLTGPEKQIAKSYARKEHLHRLSVQQLEQAILLEEPLWVAEMLILIGQNLVDVAEQLNTSPLPPQITPSLEPLYRKQMDKLVTQSLMNALRYSSEAEHLTHRLGMSPILIEKAKTLKEGITRKIEAGDHSAETSAPLKP